MRLANGVYKRVSMWYDSLTTTKGLLMLTLVWILVIATLALTAYFIRLLLKDRKAPVPVLTAPVDPMADHAPNCRCTFHR